MVSCLLVCLLIIKVAYSTDYFEQGNVFYGGGRLIEAESAYLLHLSTHASHADCLCNLASIYHDTGRIEDAERTYKLTLSIQPAHTAALFNLAMMLQVC
jgi:tetratricopeptide (TPR) repeat protein